MALPILNTMTYELELPSTGEQVTFRPFLVKEEKVLLMAAESGEQKDIIRAIKQIIKNCLVDSDLNVNNLAMIDLEYFFLQLRARSIGETLPVTFKPDCFEECKQSITVDINVEQITVEKGEEHDDKIKITDEIMIKLTYPSVNDITNIAGKTATDALFLIIENSIEYIMVGEEMYFAKDHTKKELQDFLNSLSAQQFTKVRDFYESMPRLKHTIEYECPVCKVADKKELVGLESFFTLA